MNTKTIIFSMILGIALTGCKQKLTTLEHERGFVVAKQFTPEFDANSVGFTTRGDATFHHTHDEEKYSVVFRCEHGKVFSINSQSLFGKVNEGDTVTIDFYEIVNMDGKVVDYDFVDANR